MPISKKTLLKLVRKSMRKKTKYHNISFGRKKKQNRQIKRRLSFVNLGKSIVPLSTRATTTYCDNDFSFTSTAGAYARHTFAINGLYDTDFSGGGHNPIGWSQIMALYDHYQVLNAKMTITITHCSQRAVVGLITSDTTGPPSALNSLSTFQENPGSYYKFLIRTDDNRPYVTLTKTVNMAKFFGLKKTQYVGEDKYQGNSSTNPNDLVCFHIQAWGLNGATSTIRYSIRIEFDSLYTEPKALTAS